MNKNTINLTIKTAFLAALATTAVATEITEPNAVPTEVTKPVKVFIIMGQSNTLEMGKVTGGEGSLENAVKTKGLYPYLVNESGDWAVRDDVRNVSVMVKKGVYRNDWLTVNPKKIGIEIGVGNVLGEAIEEPVMVLKSSIGNRALGWDLLPPGSERYTIDGVTYCGYKDNPTAEVLPYGGWVYKKPVKWYAGKQYDDDVANAKKVLENIAEYYPGATSYEVAGFIWWQGDKDSRNEILSRRYETNLVQLIKALRKDFNSPNAKFVCATLGQTEKGATGNGGLVLDAQLAVDGETGKYPEFKGNVATVYTHPLSKGSSSGAHYGGNAETYMNVGQAMGEAMVKLLNEK